MSCTRPMILVILRDHALRHATGCQLTRKGYHVRLASSGARALAILQTAPVGCVIVDAVLQDMYGQDLLGSIRVSRPAIPAILVQGSPDPRAVLACREQGATEYLAGPLVASALLAAVTRALNDETRSVMVAAQPSPESGREEAPAGRNGERRARQMAAQALDALVRAMEAKDPHLAGHSIRVAELAASIATEMGREDWEVEEIRLAGRLHDIGMIAISDAILTKPGRLTAEEFSEVKRHPLLGYQLLVAYPGMERVASYVRGHHEQWDGKGYPDGLAAEAIPFGARILTAAETFDALTTSRSYRSAASVSEALDRMRQTAAQAVEPAVMEALQEVIRRRRALEFIRDDGVREVEAAMFGDWGDPSDEFERAVAT